MIDFTNIPKDDEALILFAQKLLTKKNSKPYNQDTQRNNTLSFDGYESFNRYYEITGWFYIYIVNIYSQVPSKDDYTLTITRMTRFFGNDISFPDKQYATLPKKYFESLGLLNYSADYFKK